MPICLKSFVNFINYYSTEYAQFCDDRTNVLNVRVLKKLFSAPDK